MKTWKENIDIWSDIGKIACKPEKVSFESDDSTVFYDAKNGKKYAFAGSGDLREFSLFKEFKLKE